MGPAAAILNGSGTTPGPLFFTMNRKEVHDRLRELSQLIESEALAFTEATGMNLDEIKLGILTATRDGAASCYKAQLSIKF